MDERLTMLVCLLSLAVGGAVYAQQQVAQVQYELQDAGLEEVSSPDPATARGELQVIRTAIADRQGKYAAKLATDWIKSHPNHPDLPEAYLLRGDARVVQGNYYKALFDYEYLVRAYPESPLFERALEREFEVARIFGSGVNRKFLGLPILPATGEAEELFIRIQERSPGSKLAERSGKELGDLYFQLGNMPLAAEAYSLFVDNFPRSQWQRLAMQQQIAANLATFKGPRYDATGLLEAERRIAQFKGSYPDAAEQFGADAALARIDESLGEKSLETADWYFKKDMRVSAIYMYRRVVTDHPRSAAAQAALARLRVTAPAIAKELAGKATEAPALRPPPVEEAAPSPPEEAAETPEPVEAEPLIEGPPAMTEPEQ